MRKRAGRKINRTRRAEIGAERRSRTRAAILLAALDLLGRPHGRATRIEDVCARARIARGTFYNYFTGMEELLESLSDALTRDFDAAVHSAFELLSGPAERTCAAIRYYLHGAIQDPRWGWAMVNCSVGTTLFGEEISNHVQTTIQEGMDNGDFTIKSAEVGRDILLGTGIAATISVLQSASPADYPEKIAFHLLLGLGASAKVAEALTGRPLRDLPRVSPRSPFFRGALGGVERVGTERAEAASSESARPRRRGARGAPVTRAASAAFGSSRQARS